MNLLIRKLFQMLPVYWSGKLTIEYITFALRDTKSYFYFFFLNILCFSLQLEQLIELFDREQITLEILAEMGHEDLKQVGVSAYGFRHKILKGIAQLRATTGKFNFVALSTSPHQLIILLRFCRFGSNAKSRNTSSRLIAR